jgi:sugar phosphate permease
MGYFIFAGICLVLSLLFMQARPEIPPSEGAIASKLSSTRETFRQIRDNPNLWKFFPAYCVNYGTFIAFAANSNFIIKPYGYSDIEIAVNAVLLMAMGTVGAILVSLYIKKTHNYQRALRGSAIGSAVMLIILSVWLNTANKKVMTTIIISLMGCAVTPLVPICYELGCELSFPMGEAMVTGLLNGGALLWAFLSSAFVSAVFGYENAKSSLVIMIILSIFVVLAALSFFLVKMDLKRRAYE